MKYSIKKNWVASFEVILNNPVLLLPFVFIAFFETLTLELIYFSTRFPLSAIAAPIIRKFFGEAHLHYPAHLVIIPSIFYYVQIGIYITVGAFLTAISVNIFKNVKEKLPVRANAMVRNAAKRYGAFLLYGVIFMALMAALQPFDKFILVKAVHLAQKIAPRISGQLISIGSTIFLFLTTFLLQAIFIASIPFMVLEKKPVFKAIFSSMALFIRNMFTVIGLIALPFLSYLPLVILKGVSRQLVDATFPEIVLAVTLAGSIASIFVDSFMLVCICRFITDRQKTQGKTP